MADIFKRPVLILGVGGTHACVALLPAAGRGASTVDAASSSSSSSLAWTHVSLCYLLLGMVLFFLLFLFGVNLLKGI